MGSSIHALLLATAKEFRNRVESVLTTDSSVRLDSVASIDDALRSLKDGPFQVVLLCDGKTPETLLSDTNTLRTSSPDTPIVVLTPAYDPEKSRSLLKAGAQDILPLDDMSGPSLVRCIEHSITRYVRAGEPESLSRILVERSPEPTYWIDEDSNIAYVNDAAVKALGYTREELLTRALKEIDPDTSEIQGRQRHLEMESTGFTIFQSRHRRKDGVVFPVEIRGHLIHFGGRQFICAIARDITDKLRTEAERELLQRLATNLAGAETFKELGQIVAAECRQMFDHGAFILSLVDEKTRIRTDVHGEDTPEGASEPVEIEPNPPVGLNEQQLKAFYSAPHLVHRPEGKRTPPFTGGGVMSRISRCVMLAPVKMEGQFVGALSVHSYTPEQYNDKDLEVLTSIAIQCQGALHRIRTAMQLDRAEEKSRNAQKMEAIGRLAGGVAHDFNNLLSAIIGFSQLAKDQTDADNPIQEPLDQIRRAGERAAVLTRQLLAISRRQVLSTKVIQLNKVLTELEPMIRSLVGENIEVLIQKAEPLGNILADRGQVEQVIINLVVNARDAMPRGGKILLETENKTVDDYETSWEGSLEPGRYITMSVKDNGVGMDEKTLSHIFEPFFSTKQDGGTGLGLSTVYGIVRQSGGSIRVASLPGKGTIFTVHFPQTTETRPPSSELQAVPPRQGTGTILLVEDEAMVRNLARQILEKAGYTVLQAGDGEEALRVGGEYEKDIHLVFSDVIMPGMNGPEMARALSKKRDFKMLFMSGYADEVIARQGIPEGEVPFLQKPFSPEQLLRKVKEALGG